MTDYSQIGNAIKATLLADFWLGNTANVKTVEVHKRGFMLQDARDAQYFGDLPAIAIVPNAKPKTSVQTTTHEIRSVVKSQVIAISRNRDSQTGRDAQALIVANLERVLEEQKTSARDLGIDAYVFNISSVEEQFKDGDHYIFVTTTGCDIEITAQF